MANVGVPDIIRCWIRSFLSQRQQRVKVDGSYSDYLEVTSGVPQGSVLGPFLFLLYLYDLPSVVKYCKIQIYSDDTKVYFRFPRTASSAALQQDLDSIMEWFEEWGLKVAAEKCFVLPLRVQGDRPCFDYKINDSSVPVVDDSIRDLGVLVHPTRSHHAQVRSVKSKANSRTGLIFRSFKTRNRAFLLKMYKCFVRSTVEYASSAWNPHKIQDIVDLESVQRLFTRRIPGLGDFSYPERLNILEMKSLEERRLRRDLVELFKIVTNRSGLDFGQILAYADDPNTSQANQLQINIKFRRTTLGQHSIFADAIRVWNRLPQKIVGFSSVSSFCSALEEINLLPDMRCFPNHYV